MNKEHLITSLLNLVLILSLFTWYTGSSDPILPFMAILFFASIGGYSFILLLLLPLFKGHMED